MKYMTFNSSCSYAGLANMLEKIGIDVEDYDDFENIKFVMPMIVEFDFDDKESCLDIKCYHV